MYKIVIISLNKKSIIHNTDRLLKIPPWRYLTKLNLN